MELAEELRVEHAEFAVEDQRARRQSRDRRRDVREARGVLTTAPADEADAAAVLERDDSPTVVLLLVDPARPVKRLRAAGVDELDVEGNDGTAPKHRRAVYRTARPRPARLAGGSVLEIRPLESLASHC